MMTKNVGAYLRGRKALKNSTDDDQYYSSAILLEDDNKIRCCKNADEMTRVDAFNSVLPRFRRRTSSVPWKRESGADADDCELRMRMRTFTLDPKIGLINRGDSYKSLHSITPTKSNNSVAGSSSGSKDRLPQAINNGHSRGSASPLPTVDCYTVLVLGADGVGKTSTISQFMSTDYCTFYNNETTNVKNQNSVYLRLDEDEFQLVFIEVNIQKQDYAVWMPTNAAGYLVMYSIDDKTTFKSALDAVRKLKSEKSSALKPVVLIGNKIDLERKRMATTEEGKLVAKSNNCKFAEISVALGHKVDEVLVGILNQIRQNTNGLQLANCVKTNKSGCKSKFYIRKEKSSSCSNFATASRQFVNKILFKANESCSKSVEDLLSLSF